MISAISVQFAEGEGEQLLEKGRTILSISPFQREVLSTLDEMDWKMKIFLITDGDAVTLEFWWERDEVRIEKTRAGTILVRAAFLDHPPQGDNVSKVCRSLQEQLEAYVKSRAALMSGTLGTAVETLFA